jgi:ribosomal protein L14E/L6E/L27E
MAAIEKGSVCVLKAGRRAGAEVTVSKVVTDNFALVRMKDGKERKVAVSHLEPTGKKE